MKAQVCIIGSGPGGAITAAKLTEAGCNVVVLEEGRNVPLRSEKPFSLGQIRTQYRNHGNTVGIGLPPIVYAEACCVGGGGEINSRIYHRTPNEILEEWRRDFDLRESGPSDLEKHFQEIENILEPSVSDHGSGQFLNPLAMGAKVLGWNTFKAPKCTRTPKETFLAQAVTNGCRLLTETRVIRISRTGAKNWLVHTVQRSGEKSTIEAEKVFLCSGAIQTPAILRRSGITHNVGNNLQMHPMLKMVAEFQEPINSLDPEVNSQQVTEFAPLMGFGCSVSTLPQLAVGLQYHESARRNLRDSAKKMNIFYATIRPLAKGRVRPVLGSINPWVIFQQVSQDRKNLLIASDRLQQLLRAARAKNVFPNSIAMSLHLFSSCPMGEDRRVTATDSFGKVHGFDNLYVNDASLLCSAPGVNPQGSIMVFALRNSLNFLKKL